MASIEAIIKHMISKNNHNIHIAFPAVVIGTGKIKDGLVDVQPIVNYQNPLSKETVNFPKLFNIRLMFPSTQNSSICFPVSQGDFVEVVIQSVDVLNFVHGNTELHDPDLPAFGNLSNAVAFAGFSPFQDSCLNPDNYSNDFDSDDLNIVHNKNTSNEVNIALKKDGDIKITTKGSVNIEARDVVLDAQSIDAKSANIKTQGDILLGGKSLKAFMNLHTHIDSTGSVTTPPQG